MSITVLYEDNHVIAVYKPAGVLAQPTKPGDESMLSMVKTYVKEKYQKPGNVFVGLLHRLDRPVCGVMLFAKTSKGAARLSEQFRTQTIQKKYQALVTGKPPKQKGTLINTLGKDIKTLKGREFEDGKEAVLHYEVLASNDKYSLLSITIEGGQFHQIRTQLSLAGMPIVGDVKYKGERWQDEQAIALCATEVSFTTATTDEMVTVRAEIPKAWKLQTQLYPTI